MKNDPLQFEPLATHAGSLAFRPAVPEAIVEQPSALRQPSTLQHPPITKQPSSIRPSCSSLRRIQRQYREHKRRQLLEKLERIERNYRSARVQSPSKPLEQSYVEEEDLRMEFQVAKSCVDWHEKKAAELLDNVDLELHSFDLVEAKLAVDAVISKIKERLDMENVRKLLMEEATLEAWQNSGRKLMNRADGERRGGERKSEEEKDLRWGFYRDWDEAIDQACEAAMEKYREGKGQGESKDKRYAYGGELSGGLERPLEPEVDLDDMLPEFPLTIDDAGTEEMDMDSPVDIAKEDTGGEVKHPEN
ncbi:58fa0921-8057-41b4-9a52-be5e3194fdd0-CDS [Sclerotinia trifoliorum]|uniref:58fa0921-8057-41b4-9a52-be5e3194fdd0-CDS n=1 Tax=Sclerotinia trifoliorum TaxID=28548 RepID=A0A8H2ZT98_9HELO|nr:58fa0921-8057-41b4-9a52-be5e3194fdd0-CDS [Sclerotinia trifoliorum]